MKKVIRLTESDLHRIVRNGVKRVLRESVGIDSPLYWKSQCLQMLKAIEQSINEDDWESIPSGADFLQQCYDNYKNTIRNIQGQNQQSAQQRTPYNPMQNQQSAQQRTPYNPMQKQQSAQQRTFGQNVDARVQQQMQNNSSMQQQMANRIRQQVMNRLQNKFSRQPQ